MQFIDFQKKLSSYHIFSLEDIRKIIPGFSYRQLNRWKKKGYLRKIKQGFYSLINQEINQNFLFYASNRIYSPSYISLESALKFYGFIPEEVFQITSVSAKKTTFFNTAIGNFSYRHIKQSLFFAYRLVDFNSQKLLIAEPEKAILDYLYLNSNLKTADDFREMRTNADEFKEKTNLVRFRKFLECFENKKLAERSELFLATLQYD